jgi:16S rRNA U516 pseudouridylate synthase RsuA-like enzyme
MKHKVILELSQESIEILENYAFFHATTTDDIADGAILMFPWHEGRSRQIREMMA